MELEPDIRLLDDGTTVDLVADVAITGPGYSVVTAVIHKNSVLVDLNLADSRRVTLFGVKKLTVGSQVWLSRTPSTLALRHQAKEFSKMSTVTEVCSGTSAVSQGYEACGAKMVSYNELNPKFAAWWKNRAKSSLRVMCHVRK